MSIMAATSMLISIRHLKCALLELGCGVSVKYTLNLEDFV